MLSFSELMILSASACFLRSISITAAGALFTNFSLPSFFRTPCKKPSLCFSSASIRAISASTSIMLPRGTAYSVVPTMKAAAPSALASTAVTAERLHIMIMTASKAATGFSPTTCYSSAAFWSMFFCKRLVRTLLITSFTTSICCTKASSTSVDMEIGLTIRLSPSLRSTMCCHNSSVMNGMNGCNRCNRLTKKPLVVAYTIMLKGGQKAS